MIVKTITCHDVYNVGAGLQAYALCTYLQQCGHEVQIIHYKPDYLSRHYSLSWVNNPRFDKPLIKWAFLAAKLPARLKALRSGRKKRFDAFREQHLPLTRRYDSFEELKAHPPKADVYIAGSDQIWNPLFPNGKDPAFFLEFVPDGKRRVSYAASFAVEQLSEEDRVRIAPWLTKLDAVSVREASGVCLLSEMGVQSVAVCDPVFLPDKAAWDSLAVTPPADEYILVYDFDNSPLIRKQACALREQTGRKIVSVFPVDYADEVWFEQMGPCEFLGAIRNAATVLSNSFHATAFSLIFERDFYVMGRAEGINTRMCDLLKLVGLSSRWLTDARPAAAPIDWAAVRTSLSFLTEQGRQFLTEQIG